MKSLTINREIETVNISLTRYFEIGGVVQNTTTSAGAGVPIREAGVFSNLYTYVSANSITANSVLTLQKSGTNTSVTITYGSSQTGVKEDNANSDTYANTDTAGYELVTGGSGTSITFYIIGIQFTPTNSSNTISFFTKNESAMGWSIASLRYQYPTGGAGSNTSETAPYKWRARASFVASNFTAYITANTWTNTLDMTTRKNSGAGGQSLAVPTTQTGLKEDTSGTDTLASGDDFGEYGLPRTGSGSISVSFFSVSLKSTAGIFATQAFSSSVSSISFNVTTYVALGGTTADGVTARSAIWPRFNFTAKELQVYVNSNSIATSNTTITLQKTGVDTSVAVSYAPAETGLKFDSSNTTNIASGADKINAKVVTPNTSGTIGVFSVGILGEQLADPIGKSYLSSQSVKRSNLW